MENEKVILPKKVAGWLEKCKYDGLALGQAINDITPKIDKEVFNWLWDAGFRLRQIHFANAWIYGYEKEPEQLYIVELPNPHSDDKFGLYRKKGGYIAMGRILSTDGKTPDALKLTEDEIKKDFPWVFEHGFVKKV